MIGYERYCQMKQAEAAGRTAPQIARELNLHVQTVRKWLERERYERSRGAQSSRRSKLDAFKPAIVRWVDGHPFTGMQLWHKLKEQGYTGGSLDPQGIPPAYPAKQHGSVPHAEVCAGPVRAGRLGQLRRGARGRHAPGLELLCPGPGAQPLAVRRVYAGPESGMVPGLPPARL